MNQPKNSLMLADGTVLENCSCGSAENSLWCWISGHTMTECFRLFSDPEKTKMITVLFNASGVIYRGYTDLMVIKKGLNTLGETTIDIRLSWPEGGEHSIEEIKVLKDEEPKE